ncbi:MAG: hypothetical protein V4582_02715 [Pseudomonadota bacterium]
MDTSLYLSEFSVSKEMERDPFYAEAIQAVLVFCERRGIECQRSADFVEYNEIERRIDDADVFVALIDLYWNSSTWKGHELSYSGGGPSMVGRVNGSGHAKRIAVLIDSAELPSYLSRDPVQLLVVRGIPELNEALNRVFLG